MKDKIQALALAICVVCVVLFSTVGAFAEGISVLQSNRSVLKLNLNTQYKQSDTVLIDGKYYILPKFGSANARSTESNQGGPANFLVSEDFTVPSPNGFKITDFKVIRSRKVQGLIIPNSRLAVDNADYVPIPEKYLNFSNEPIKVFYKGIAGGHHIAGFEMAATLYNNDTQTIEIIEEAELTISFDESKAIIANHEKTANAFTNLNSNTVPNWIAPKNIVVRPSGKEAELQASNDNNWAKVSIESEGAYYLDASDFNKLGATLTPELVKTIKVYSYGGDIMNENPGSEQFKDLPEQEIIVQTDGNGNLDKVIFYASPTKNITRKFNSDRGTVYLDRYNNPYSNNSYYLIAWGGSQGKRATPKEYSGAEIVNRPVIYKHRIYSESDDENVFHEGSGRQWLGRSIFPLTITNRLYNLDRSEKIEYRLRVAQRLTDTGSYGNFNISENNNTIRNISISGSSNDAVCSLVWDSIPAAKVASDDRSVIKIDYSTSKQGIYGVPYLDYYIISYPRSFTAINNELAFDYEPSIKGGTETTINNFQNGTIYGWDVSNPAQPILMKNYSSTGSIFVLKSEPSDLEQYRYFLSSNPIKANPEKITFPNFRADLTSPDILVITHPNLKSSAEEYAKYRNSQGKYSAKVFLTSDIYTEFGAGMPDPTAIRNFISYKYHNSDKAPKFVILWGDAHYDYKNVVTKNVNFVPTWESIDDTYSFDANSSYCTDDYFAIVDGEDDLMDIAIGRIPANDNENGLIMLEKIRRYETASATDDWKTNFTFLADDTYKKPPETESPEHVSQSELSANDSILNNFQITKIYLAQYPLENVPSGRRKPKVTEDLISKINTSGTLILNFIGHGNPRVWTDEEVLERETTIPLFRNPDKMFFCFAATCSFARFDLAEHFSGGEAMTQFEQGGAIGVLIPARSVFINANGTFTYHFYSELMRRNSENKYKTIGEVTLALKNRSVGDEANKAKYALLCDPVITLHIPESKVEIEKINDIKLAETTEIVELKGLAKVTIKAYIAKPNGEKNSEFNGSAIVTLIDASEQITVDENNSYTSNIQKVGNALSKSSALVVNGELQAEFYIPKDISFAAGSAKILIYAIDTTNQNNALGGTDRIRVRAIDETAIVENNGPELKVYLDSRRFESGNTVGNTPLLIVDLSDDTGINTAGAGIGHKIEAWLDDSDESIDLTSLYKSSFTNSKAGSIEKILFELSGGMHTIKVRAWDVFNNPTVTYTNFKIIGGNSVMVLNTYMYPNPITESGSISITHTASTSYDVEINIFNMDGSLVNTIRSSATNLNNTVANWDGKDSDGKALAIGAYYYSVKLQTEYDSAMGYGKFVVVR